MPEYLSVVIIDDEYRIGQMLSRLIHFDALNMRLMKVFESSKEALQYIISENPDIVITDIQMPIIDGLELIRQSREAGLSPHFILISGYKEFEYARTALKYGVEDYLLKPVNEAELNRVLSQVCIRHSETVQINKEKEILQESAKREHLLSGVEALKVLTKDDFDGTLTQFNEQYHTSLQQGAFLPFVLKFDYDDPNTEDQLQDRFVAKNVINQLEEYFGSGVYEQLYASTDNSELYGIINYDQKKNSEILFDIKKAFTQISNHVEAVPGYRITMALGNSCQFERIGESIRLAEKRIVQRLILGTRIVITDIVIPDDPDSGYLSAKFQTRIHNAVISFNSAELASLIDTSFSDISSKNNINANSYINNANSFIDAFFSVFPQTAQTDKERIRITNIIEHCWNVEMMIENMKSELPLFLTQQSRDRERQTRKPIREALDYIENHYGEKITLESISDQLQMNSSYLSTLFKKETGETFQDYLTQYRIDRAKEMLTTTSETMASIALHVGYTDTRYFSQNFTRIVGIKPSLYRKMYS